MVLIVHTNHKAYQGRGRGGGEGGKREREREKLCNVLLGLSVGRQPILQLVDLVPTGAPLARVNDARVEHDVQPFVHAAVDVVGLVLHVVHDEGAGRLGLQQLSGRRYAVVKTAVVPAVTA